MSENPEKKKARMDANEVKEILGVVSTEVPGLIKSIIASVFSEEAGKSMGKAAAAFYRELKEGGMPDDVAVKMTEDYISVFTSLGDVMKGVGVGRKVKLGVGKEVERRVEQKLAEKQREEDEEEEDEEED